MHRLDRLRRAAMSSNITFSNRSRCRGWSRSRSLSKICYLKQKNEAAVAVAE